MHERFIISSSTKMHYSSLLLITMFSLLIISSTTIMASSSYDNYHPYNNYPSFSFQTPPPPPPPPPSSSPGDNYGSAPPPPMVDYTPPPDAYNEASPPPPPDNNYYGSPPSPSPPNGNNDDDKTQFLKEHNEARHKITTPPKLPLLVWNEALAAYALNYANQRKDDCGMVHSGGTYGENIAAGSGNFSAKEAVDFWVTEKNNYNYTSNTCPGGDQVCGHYTQVVWRNTVRLGCARMGCKSKDMGSGFFVICNYDPPGNVDGEKPY